MSIIQFIRGLNEKGIHFSCVNNQLKIKALEGVLNNEIIAEIRSKREDIINFLRDIELSTKGSEIRKTEKKEYYKLTSAQQRLFFLYNFDKSSIAYNILYAFRINGVLEKKRLQNTFTELIARHESLRTSFHIINGGFVQKIEKSVQVHIDYEEATEDEIRIIINDFNKPFDLSKSPLIQVKVINLSALNNVLLINIHHIATDGSSFEILKKDFIAIYHYNKLPELKLQYKDYSEWQQDKQHKSKIDEQKIWWMNEFLQMPSLLEFPADYKRPPVMTYEGAVFNYELSDDLTSSIKLLAEKENTTFFNVLLAVFNILFAKLSNQQDVVIGIPSTGRKNKYLEDIIGIFANTLPLRNYPKEDLRFIDFLSNVKKKTIQAIENQSYPIEDLINDLNLDRDTSRNPLFDVMFIMNDNYQKDEANGELSIKPYSFDSASSKFDMLILATDNRDSLSLSVEYYSRLYREVTIERFVNYFLNILSIVLKDPAKKIDEIEIVSKDEKNRLLFEFNNTKYDYKVDKTLFELFENQQAKTPNKIALNFGSHFLTYLDLYNKANLFSIRLIEKGISSGQVVGLLMERSNEMIIAMYSIFKVGATLLPLDPSYPSDRISYIVKNSKCKILIADGFNEHKYDQLKGEDSLHDYLVLDYDVINHAISNKAIEKTRLVASDQVVDRTNIGFNSSGNAYLLYTSGSTGLPKGIIIEHKSVVNFITGITNIIDFEESDNILALTTIAFDIFVLETFLPLSIGLTVIIANEEQQISSLKLSRLINSMNISLLQFTPSRLQLLLDDEDNSNCLAGVKTLMVGGEAFSEGLLVKLKKRFKGKIYNMYGPTETTVWSTVKELTNESIINIGKPIANTQIYILNANKKLQPIGVPGELFIGGAGLAKGYVNNEEFTNQRFISSPFIEGHRIYSTGDLARWNQNGEIEYLGRIDNQVKIRGYRIELGEIEKQMLLFPAVREAVVHVKGKDSNANLIGYYTSEKQVEAKQLRLHLTKCLPEYMIPVHFMHLSKFPLTPNGKVDRKKLPDFELAVEKEHVSAKNINEKKLVEIWSEILNLPCEKISTNANFFGLGGHSLRAAIMVNKIHKEYNIEIPIKEIFRLQNIQSIAGFISASEIKQFEHIIKTEKKEYYKLSSAQHRLYLLYLFNKSSIAYNIPNTLHVKGQIDYERLTQAFNKLISHHENLRSTFHIANDIFVQKIEEVFPLTIEQFSSNESETQNLVRQFVRPFDLSCSPLIRVGLIKIKEDEHILMVDMHHIISDGMSESILINDFMALYNNEALPDIDIQYKDYAEWQQSNSQQINLVEQKKIWMNEFAEEINVLDLPTDFSRPTVQAFDGNSVDFIISNEDAAKLKGISEKEGVTTFMVLLSIFNILLGKLSNQEDIVVGTPTAGRRHADVESMIGLLVNTLAIRNKVRGELSFKEFLTNVKLKTLVCFDNQDFQYEDLIDVLKIERNIGRNPLFDTMFVFQNFETSELCIPELTLKPYRHVLKTSKFDLTLMAHESEDQFYMRFEYSTMLFKIETIERIIGYLKNIIAAVTEDENIRISEIEILSKQEKHQFLHEFSNTKTPYPKNKTVIDLFDEQVQRTPDGIAIKFKDYSITYKELKQRVDSLAYKLRGNGVISDTVIALYIDRSLETIIGMLSILKAGGAYLPIDVDYPLKRVEYIIKNSGAKILLTKKEMINKQEYDLSILFIDDAENLQSNLPEIRNISYPSDICYVIYTSGTTGNPKGVMVEHRNVVRLFFNDEFQFDFGERDVWTMFHSHCFDFSVWEIYGALLYGGKLIVIPKSDAVDTNAYVKILKKETVTVLNQTPSAFNNLIYEELSCPDTSLNLKYVVFGGEALLPKRLKTWKEKYPNTKLINMFGITETTVHVTYKEIGVYEIENNISNIGKPIPTLSVYILDSYQKLLPLGVIGELYVGGEGVARGYLGNNELTNKRFILNPYKSDERLYRSGDLGRMLNSGDIEYIGRADHQVQLRGFRIELGEIENHLLDHELIHEVTVLMKEQGENKYLVAYFVSTDEINISVLKNFLSDKLPVYMIPSFFIRLTNMPLTTNGKIDKKLLPEPGVKLDNEYFGPTNDIERRLIGIWSEILKISKELISVNRNFFEIGGNSLNATILTLKIKREFAVEFSIMDLFKLNTVEEQALLITASQNLGVEEEIEDNAKTLVL